MKVASNKTQTNQPQEGKDHLRGEYATFLKSEAGKDLIAHAQLLEKAYFLEAMQKNTSDEKASSVSKAEGVIRLRDYVVRMSKKK